MNLVRFYFNNEKTSSLYSLAWFSLPGYKSKKVYDLIATFGPQVVDKMMGKKSPQKYFLLSLSSTEEINTKERGASRNKDFLSTIQFIRRNALSYFLSKSIPLRVLHFIIAFNLFNVQAANKALATNKLWKEAGDKEELVGGRT